MVKALSTSDFRATRHILEADDYALPGTDTPPRDLIDQGTWHSIWDLPDSVAIATTDDFGQGLREIDKLVSAWSCTFEPLGLFGGTRRAFRPLGYVALEVGDAFGASVMNAVVGYYRVAFMSLRSIVENMTVALHLQLAGDRKKYRAWLKGKEDLKFGNEAGQVRGHQPIAALEAHLGRRIGNDLFRQKNGPQKHGHVRELFSVLSKYAHAFPGFMDGDLWGSNGPIFAHEAFVRWAQAFLATYALSVLMLRLGQPQLNTLDGEYGSMKELFDAAVELLPPRAPLRRTLKSVPLSVW
jgi:hypothetical protein